MANVPAVITCTDVMAEQHPELVVAFMKGMIKVGRWANEHKHAAAAILDKQTFYLDVEDTYEGIKHVDMVPNLSPQNLASVEIGKDFMLSHGYIKNDFDVHKWAAPEFLEQAARGAARGAVEEGDHGEAARDDRAAGGVAADRVAGRRWTRHGCHLAYRRGTPEESDRLRKARRQIMKVIIVGGVAGGASCAARLRRLDEKAEILMVERGPYVSYANCGLPYHVGGVIEQESSLLVATEQMFRAIFAIDCRTRCEAIGHLAEGEDRAAARTTPPAR